MTAATHVERRSQPRPQAPRPGWRQRLHILTDRLALRVFASLPRSIAFFVALAAFIAIAVWSLAVRLPDTDTTQRLQQQLAQLQQQYRQLSQGWSATQLAELENSLQTQQARVLPDFTALARWLDQQTRLADTRSLGLQYRILPLQNTRLDDTVVVPLVLMLKPGPTRADKQYQQVLAFMHALIDDRVQLAIDSVTLDGNGSDVSHVKIETRIWVKDPTDMAALAAGGAETDTMDRGDEDDFE